MRRWIRDEDGAVFTLSEPAQYHGAWLVSSRQITGGVYAGRTHNFLTRNEAIEFFEQKDPPTEAGGKWREATKPTDRARWARLRQQHNNSMGPQGVRGADIRAAESHEARAPRVIDVVLKTNGRVQTVDGWVRRGEEAEIEIQYEGDYPPELRPGQQLNDLTLDMTTGGSITIGRGYVDRLDMERLPGREPGLYRAVVSAIPSALTYTTQSGETYRSGKANGSRTMMPLTAAEIDRQRREAGQSEVRTESKRRIIFDQE